MANYLVVKDGAGVTQNLAMGGAGTTADPWFPRPLTLASGVTAAIVNTTPVSVIAAPAGALRLHICSVILHNDDATPTVVVLQDGSGGTTKASFYLAAQGQVTVSFPVPLVLTAATALFAACVTTAAAVVVTAVGYSAA